jgi:hypothetical protein
VEPSFHTNFHHLDRLEFSLNRRKIHLLVSATGVMNVIAAVTTAKENDKMRHFTIDAENNITIHNSAQDAEAVANAEPFKNAAQLAKLADGWPVARLVDIWNSLPGASPVKKFTDRKRGVERIWKGIQSLGETPAASSPEAPTEEPVAAASEQSPEVASEATIEPAADQTAASAEKDTALPAEVSEPALQPEAIQETATPAEPVAIVDAPGANVAPGDVESTQQPTVAKKAPKAPKVAKPAKTESGPREWSKTAQVVAMLQREGGATLTEIMEKVAWQKHTVRGFMAGAMKKAGYAVEWFKPEGGERTYRINQ